MKPLGLPRLAVRRAPVDLETLRLSRARLAAIAGFVVLGLVWLSVIGLAEPFVWGALGTGHDARPYWETAMRDPYARNVVGGWDSYLYSPAFLQVLAPLRSLPWIAFIGGWEAILLVATAALAGPVLLAPVALFVTTELWGGNVTLLIALAVVAGFRWPATWSFVLLTKVTPGVGLLWFAVRREWWSLATALGATLAVVAISTVVAPGVWRDWIDLLLWNAGRPIASGSIPIPLVVRFPIAVALLIWGGLTDRRWVVPVACLLALPVIWYGSLSLLAGVIPLALPDLAKRWPILGVRWRDLLGDRSAVPLRTESGSNG